MPVPPRRGDPSLRCPDKNLLGNLAPANDIVLERLLDDSATYVSCLK